MDSDEKEMLLKKGFGALCTEYDSLLKGMNLVTTSFISRYRACDKPFNKNGVYIILHKRAPIPI